MVHFGCLVHKLPDALQGFDDDFSVTDGYIKETALGGLVIGFVRLHLCLVSQIALLLIHSALTFLPFTLLLSLHVLAVLPIVVSLL